MPLFICPVCGEELKVKGSALVCRNGHSHDIARQGYVNLLPVNRRHSDNPGDSREMVLSRRSFLEKGYYNCFSDKLNELVLTLLNGKKNAALLDCGCGEGYYGGRLLQSLCAKNIDCEFYGFDISKEAVRAASGKYKAMHLCVGSCFNMPVKSGAFDIAINIFSTMVEHELHRVLKDGGYFIYAVPGAQHLMGLKKILYENVYENEEKDTDYEGFRFIGRYSVKNNIEVCAADLENLFKMTPYYYKSSRDAVERLQTVGAIKTDIHFDFLVYQKLG